MTTKPADTAIEELAIRDSKDSVIAASMHPNIAADGDQPVRHDYAQVLLIKRFRLESVGTQVDADR